MRGSSPPARTTLMAGAVLALTSLAAASPQDGLPSPTGEWGRAVGVGCAREASADAPAKAEGRLKLQGMIDTYYAYNFIRPPGGASFVPGLGSSAKRHDEFSLNLVSLDLAVEPAPVGARLILSAGTGAQLIHAVEPAGDGIGPDVWRHVQQASLSYQTGWGRGLLLEAGVFPCHVGFEAAANKDNWTYTRSWLTEFSPFYSAGVKASYSFDDHWSAQLHLLNGWQTIGETNHSKTLGTQIAWNSKRWSVSLNTLVGREQPGNDEQWRAYGDLVLSFKASDSLSLGACVDAAREGRAEADAASWKGVAGYMRYAPPKTRWALVLRGEVFDDPDAGISGHAQRLTEGTATLELRPADRLILRLEGRYDHSDREVFESRSQDAEKNRVFKNNQALLVLGAV